MTTFKGVTNIGDATFDSVLKSNIMTLFDWGFVDIGAYYNVNVPTSGFYGGTFHELHPVDHPNYTSGQVWSSSRKNWMWETGVTKGTPISVSGVFVNDTLLSSGYYIDYPNGYVVFDSGRPLTDNVHMEYSYKWIDFVDSDNMSLFQKIHDKSMRVDDGFYPLGSGDFIELHENNTQLPAVAVETGTGRTYRGHEIGSSALVGKNIVVFHVLAENYDVAAKIADIISLQENKTYYMFDLDRMISSGAFPLNYRGELVDSNLTYPQLVKPTGDGGYRWTSGAREGKIRFYDMEIQKGSWLSNDIYQMQVKMSTEAILYMK